MATTVDFHNHIIPAGFIDRVRKEGARHGFAIGAGPEGEERLNMADGPSVELPAELQASARGTWTRIDADVRRREMAEAGIDLAVQSVAPTFMS